MAKVTVHDESPSEAIVKRAAQPVEVTDAFGRTLKVRKIGALHRYDLAKIIGPEASQNPVASVPATLAFSVIEIDGEHVSTPRTENEIRVLIQRLEDEGLEAVMEAHVEKFGVGDVTTGEGKASPV